MAECDTEDLPDDVSVLRTTIQNLRRREKQLLKYKEQSEIEFGQRRAKFKELYLAREDEIAKEKTKLKEAQEEAKKLKNELNRVVDECNGYKTAAALAESSQKEELQSLHTKYQEEVASLQHIMSEAVLDAQQGAGEQFEMEKHNLMAQNKKLENEVRNLKSILSSDGNGSVKPRMLSGLSDAVVGAIKRNTSHNSPVSDEEAVSIGSKSLEKSMEKAQEDAKVLRSIVLPLEEEIISLKTKLQDSQDKLQTAEAKIKEAESKNHEINFQNEESLSKEKFDEMQEKIKELNQYLDAERSSRTDLEMYVAVLNTQKGVLQEDTDKLRKELHDVCRLLEQEKAAHSDLKNTWEMANLQFVENLRVQKEAYTKVWNILTTEQRIIAQEQQQDESQVGKLIDLQSPQTSPQPTVQQPSLTHPPAMVISSGSSWDNIPTVPCTNQLIGGPDSVTAPIQDDKEAGFKRSHSASDITIEEETNSGEVSRTRSVEEILSTTPKHEEPISLPGTLPGSSSKGLNSNVDWKVFQEAVKVSHKSDLSRSCAMCVNYERQLQKMQEDNQKFQNLASNFKMALDQEKKELFKEQKMRSKLEESVARAAEDAQMQINSHKMTNDKLEKLMAGLWENFEATKHGAKMHIEKLVSSRDQLSQELNALKSKYTALQDNAIQQLTYMDSDARLAEMQGQLMQIRAASENTEEKLRSEVTFLKDRVIAEQFAKDSLEAMLQGDVDNMRSERDKLKEELVKEQSAKEVSKVVEENRRLKNQLQSMTEQLNQSETVQRDFVRLSQSLQMQIAQIHESETDVRWQYPEDITECPNCNRGLKSSREKRNCHHCGKVFCENCTTKSVLGNNSNRPHPVCDNCFAILSKDSKSTFYNTSLADDQR